jgi:hypothetical protein
MRLAKILRRTAFTFMMVFGLVGTLFVAGYAFEDPGGLTAVWMTAAWVLPMAALAGLALLRPETGGPVLTFATVLVLGFTVIDSVVGVVPRDDVGPVAAITVFALAVALAALGLHRAKLAGVLMVTTALAQLAATALGVLVHENGEGPGLGALLGTSSGVVVVPVLIAGAAFWLAGVLADEHVRPVWPEQSHLVG